jgi:hypothetical protein
MGEMLAIMMGDARKKAAKARAIFHSINTANTVREGRLKLRPTSKVPGDKHSFILLSIKFGEISRIAGA